MKSLKINISQMLMNRAEDVIMVYFGYCFLVVLNRSIDPLVFLINDKTQKMWVVIRKWG